MSVASHEAVVEVEVKENTILPIQVTSRCPCCDGLFMCCPTKVEILKQCNIVLVMDVPSTAKRALYEELLSDFDVGYVSTTELIQVEVESGSLRGQQMRPIFERGEMVAPDIVLELLCNYLMNNSVQHKNFLVDGFPHDLEQAARLEELIHSLYLLQFKVSDMYEDAVSAGTETFQGHSKEVFVRYFKDKRKLFPAIFNSTDVDYTYAYTRIELEKIGIQYKESKGNSVSTSMWLQERLQEKLVP